MVDIDAVHKQKRYLSADNKTDWIDKCADSFSPTEFRGAMKFTIGKYLKRMGKKDPIAKEQAKIDDYRARWVEYEIAIWGGNLNPRPFIEAMIDQDIEALKNEA